MKKEIPLLLVASVILLNSCSSYKNISCYQGIVKYNHTLENISNYKLSLFTNSYILGINETDRSPKASLKASTSPDHYLNDIDQIYVQFNQI